MKSFWIELNPVNPSSGAVETLYLTSLNRPNGTRIVDGRIYFPYLEGYPNISVDVFDGEFNGSTTVALDGLSFTCRTQEVAKYLPYVWDGTDVRVFRGDPSKVVASGGTSQLTRIFTGVVKGSPAVQDATASLSLIDRSYVLEQGALTLTYAGTGGIEGPSGLKGEWKPMAIGEVAGASPVLIDSGFLCYQYHGYGRSGGVTTLSENGITFGPFTASIAWQGSTTATYNALKAVSLGIGQWADAPSIGVFRLGGEPASNGVLVADVRGALDGSGSLIAALPEMIRYLCSFVTPAFTLDDASFLAFQTNTNNATGNDYITSQVTIEERIAEYAKAAAGYYLFSSVGALSLGLVRRNATAQLTLRSGGTTLPLVEETKSLGTSAPYKRVRVGARKFWRVHTLEEISDALKSAVVDAGLKIGQFSTQLNGLLSDNVVSAGQEKQDLVLAHSDVTARWAGPHNTSANFPAAYGTELTQAERANVNQKMDALNNYLSGLSPAWNNSLVSTPVDGNQLRALFSDAYAAISTLVEANEAVARKRAIWDGVQGVGRPTDYADKTSANVASGIQGQAPAATDTTIQAGATRDVVLDTRNVNSPPSYYRVNPYVYRTTTEFKQLAAVGAGFGAGVFGYLQTTAPWENSSGGPVTQRITDSGGTRNIRYSLPDDSGWTNWQPEYSGNRKPFFGSDITETLNGALATLANFKTLLGNAAGFQGQGALATLSSVTYNTQISGLPLAIQPSAFFPSGFMYASVVFQNDGAKNLNTFFPEDINSNRTENRTSASISGQGPGATADADKVLNNRTEAGILRIPSPLGGALGTTLSSVTGVLRIRLPASWSDTMMTFDVQVYDYSVAAAGTYTISGYNFTGGFWVNMSASYVGPDNYRRAVRWGYENGACYVYIGDTTTVWAYPQIRVINFRAGYGTVDEPTWARGWALSITAAAPQNVSDTVSSPHAGEARFGLNLLEGVNLPATIPNFKTSQGNSAGIQGQGSLATQNSVSYNTQIAGLPGALQPTSFFPSGFMYASVVFQNAGNKNLNDFFPEDVGSNRTENRNAASFAGQGTLATRNEVVLNTQTIRMADGTTIVNETLIVTSQGYAAGFQGQGKGATANNLADLDKAASDKLNSAAGGTKQTVPYNQQLTRALDPGGVIVLTGYVFKDGSGSTGGTTYAQIYGGPTGGNLGFLAQGSGGYSGPQEPGGDIVQFTFTNNTGVKQSFSFYVTAGGNGGGRVQPSQSYLEG